MSFTAAEVAKVRSLAGFSGFVSAEGDHSEEVGLTCLPVQSASFPLPHGYPMSIVVAQH
jgi:hypothetical protein